MLIYIVEDDDNIRQMEGYALKTSGFDTLECETAAEFFSACQNQLPDLVIMDIMLPGQDGISALKQLRSASATRTLPVIVVSAKVSELDTVIGLDSGADDYITKPFGVIEFISRVKAVLRRAVNEKPSLLTFHGITLDEDSHTVTADGEPCNLTYKEFCLLRYLLLNQGIVLSRNSIMDNVWKEDYMGESRTVDMHVKTLRRKLGKSGELIRTIRNVGYKLQ